MIIKLRKHPIVFSLAATFVILLVMVFASAVVPDDMFALSVMSDMVITFFIILLLGLVIGRNGFKFVFNVKGFRRGLFALLPAYAFILLQLLGLIITAEITPLLISELPLRAAVALVGGIFQTVLFRGLLITAIMMSLSVTPQGRVKAVIVSSALFLIIYIIIMLLDGEGFESIVMRSITTFGMSIIFCAAYLYSKNLLSLSVVMAVLLLVQNMLLDLVAGMSAQEPQGISFLFFHVLLIPMLMFSIWISKKAEPF